MTNDDVSYTYIKAVQSTDNVKWKKAMDEEMRSLHQNQTWKLVQLPKGKKAIGYKWVYAKKEDAPGKDNIRYKARLVAKCYAQKEGIDYNEVFSPVVKHSSIRILLALVAQFDLELAQLDVKIAFLHGDLHEEIYMSQPDGFKVLGRENWACKLSKSLYGLKQSPRQWYKQFDRFMMNQRYTRSQFDHCVYFRKLQDGSFIYLLLYVNDILIASKSKVEIDRLKAQLSSEFEMKDLGEAKKIIGMEIKRDRMKGTVCLTQTQYLKNVLQRFGIDGKSKPISTPLAPHFKLSALMSPHTDNEKRQMDHVPYANAVGTLMYAMVCTRPDISHAVSMVSRYMHNPGKNH
uniref:Putative retrotransposon protein, Ty1-copia sub-class n=1 Tax=Davidia involucrata TaxID=16924 RepID=A0A5B6ZAJ2_DAVIN